MTLLLIIASTRTLLEGPQLVAQIECGGVETEMLVEHSSRLFKEKVLRIKVSQASLVRWE